MLLDLVFWGINKVANWEVNDLPVDVLCNFWVEINDRELEKINYLSYSAAYNIAAKQTKEGQIIKVDNYLPFNLTKGQDSMAPVVTVNTRKVLKRALDDGKLPMKMVQDLYKNKLLSLS